MTKYVLLSEFTPPERGGIQASVGPIITALGTDITVVGPQAVGDGQRTVRRSLFSGRGWPRWWWLVSWLRQARRDGAQTIIFGHCSAAIIAAWLVRRTGLRYIVLVHGNDVLSERRRWYIWPFVRSALCDAAYVGANSAFVVQLLRQAGVAEGVIGLTHPFVREIDIPSDVPMRDGQHIIVVARLVPRKNIGLVIEAVAELRGTMPNIQLDIVGDGPERESLQRLIEQLQCQSNVTLHGAVEDAEKWRLLMRADVFVMVPLVRDGGVDVEGLGLVYAEAAAAHLPIVASNTGGITDIVHDGQSGMVLNSPDVSQLVQALHSLISDPERRHAYGQAGSAIVTGEFTDRVRLARLRTMVDGISTADRPLVSVIIPAYQSASTIGATIASVKRQTWSSLEIVVVDDGSTDHVTEALRPWSQEIILLRQDNAGAPAARNAGFVASHGEYVLFLDADTVLEPTAIARMMATLELHPSAAYVFSNFYFGWKKFPAGWYDRDRLRQQNYIHTTSLIRRSAQPHFDPKLKKFQDWDLWLTFDERGARGVWIDAYLFRVQPRRRGTGMSDWLPSFMYRLPGVGRGHGNATIAKYRQAEAVIRQKHGC